VGGPPQHRLLETVGGHELVDDAEPDRLGGGVEGSAEHELARPRVREAEADDLDGGAREGRADGHLVQTDA